MVSEPDSKFPSSWSRDLVNGFLVWLVGFVLYVIPGFIVAVSMGFNLGPKLKDNAEVGRLISESVSNMYQSSPYLHYGYILIPALLILWRSRVISKRSPTKSVAHGVIVATIPLILTAIPFALGGHVLMCAIAVVVLLSAGIIGALRKTPRTSPQ